LFGFLQCILFNNGCVLILVNAHMA
jgi:hypothetical protein